MEGKNMKANLTHILAVALTVCSIVAFAQTVQQVEQAKEFKSSVYAVQFIAKNDLGKTYGNAPEERSGLRELTVAGKPFLRQYIFRSVLPGKNVPSAERPDTAYQYDGQTFTAEKLLTDVNTGEDFAKLRTTAVFSESSYTVKHTMIPLHDFTFKMHGQTEEIIVLPIETVQMASVTAWKADGTQSIAIFPSKCTAENWSLNGNFSKLLIRTQDDTEMIVQGDTPKTMLGLMYHPNLAGNTLWRNPALQIKYKLSYVLKDAWSMKKDIPLEWGYSISILKN